MRNLPASVDVFSRQSFGRLVRRCLFGLVLVGCAGLLIRASYADSITNDEGVYLHAGVCAWHTRVIDLEPTNPAAFKLLAGAGAIASGVPTDSACANTRYMTLTPHKDLGSLRRLVFFARVPSIVMTLGLVVLSAWWARRIAGEVAGLIAAVLVGFDPTVIAHGHLATGDIPLTLGVLGSLAGAWSWMSNPRYSISFISGLALGFALLNKASAVLLWPSLAILVFISANGVLRERAKTTARFIGPASVAAYLVVTATYAPFTYTHPQPAILPHGFNWLLPQPWLWAAKWQQGHIDNAATYTNYLNGHSYNGGSLLYFPEAFALKSTLAELVAVLIGVVVLVLWRHEALLWTLLPGLVFFITADLSGIDIGVRYIAPAIVLFLLTAAIGISELRKPHRQIVAGVLPTVGVLMTALGPAGSLGYFNQLATGRHSYYLSDSNIDWGQDGWRLHDWWLKAGRPNIQVDLFGYLPASYYIPDALDVGVHTERGDSTKRPIIPGRLLIISITHSNLDPVLNTEVTQAKCHIGTGLVIVGTKNCTTLSVRLR